MALRVAVRGPEEQGSAKSPPAGQAQRPERSGKRAAR